MTARACRRWVLMAMAQSCAALADQPLATYPGVPHTRIGNDLVISGEYYRLAYFVTPDSIAVVARYFKALWEKDGYPVTSDGDFKDEGVVSAFATREGLQRSIVLRRHEGKTLGFTVLKDLWVKGDQAEPSHLPKVEGALFAHDAVMRGEAGGTQNRSALFSSPAQQVRDQRLNAWVARGFSLARETRVKADDGRSHRVLELARPGEQVVLTLVELDPKTTALEETWVGSDRPDAVPNDEALKERAARGRP